MVYVIFTITICDTNILVCHKWTNILDSLYQNQSFHLQIVALRIHYRLLENIVRASLELFVPFLVYEAYSLFSFLLVKG